MMPGGMSARCILGMELMDRAAVITFKELRFQLGCLCLILGFDVFAGDFFELGQGKFANRQGEL